MIVEIITTGTELLLGDILNTNVQYLSRQLNNRGFDVLYHTTVGDNYQRMQQVLEHARNRADIIITSGGLGPTRGDITKEVVMEVCHRKSYLDEESWKRIQDFFAIRKRSYTPNNINQAMLPVGCKVLTNEVGTAPGVWLEDEGKIFVLLPGPPFELVDMCEKQLFPMLEQHFGANGIIFSRVLHLRNIGESSLADLLDPIIMAQSNPTLALYARRGEVIIRMTAKAESMVKIQAMLDQLEAEIRKVAGKYIYGVDDESLASCLGKLLLERKETIAFAESCSGGLATSLMTDIAGSSAYVASSVVCYSNEIKHRLLGVAQETLDKFSAISAETAVEMAEGVKKLIGSDYGVGITGNAGPGPSEGKPVGLVYIAVATPRKTYCEELHFTATRAANKLRIATTAISMVMDKIMEENN